MKLLNDWIFEIKLVTNNTLNMACLETIWHNPKTWLPYQFWISIYPNNYDIAVEILNWKNRESNAELRFNQTWQLALNTLNALWKLNRVFEWKDEEFNKTEFQRKVIVRNPDWILSVEYIRKSVIITVNQLMIDWNRPCNNIASAIFTQEWQKTKDDLVYAVNEKIFGCFAYLQWEMKKDFDSEKSRYINL